MRAMVTDGTDLYMAVQDTLQKGKEGLYAPLVLNTRFVALTFGNSILYGATTRGLYSIHATTGVMTEIVVMEGITGIAFLTNTHMLVVKGNTLLSLVLGDGTYTYADYDLNF